MLDVPRRGRKSVRAAAVPVFCIVLALLAAAAQTAARADSPDTAAKADSVYSLDKIVVTASRTAHRLSETPAAAGVIDKEFVKVAPAKTIEDLLSTQTSVQLRRPVAIGEGMPSDIIIRGIPGSLMASRTLILVDGIPTNPSGTPFLIVNQIPMEALERIEVVRGPYSCLYGANAFGGVVSMVTQEGNGPAKGSLTAETSYPFSAAYRHATHDESAVTSLGKAGSDAYYNVNGTVRGGNDKLGIVVSTGYRTIGNYLLSDTAGVLDGLNFYGTRADNHDYKEYRLFGKARFFPNDKSDISLHVRYFNSELGAGKTKYIVPDSADIVTKGHMVLIGPQAKFELSKRVKIHTGAYYRFTTGEFYDEDEDGGIGVQSYRRFGMHDWTVEGNTIVSLGSANTLTAGMELLGSSADFGPTSNPQTGRILPSSHPTNESIVNGGVFVQDEVNFFERLNLVPGARVDYHSLFGAALSPKLGALYKICDFLRFRASAGRSFRAPALTELNLALNTSSFKITPNPDLKPEYLWGFDGGFDLTASRSVVFKIGAFYNAMQDLISPTFDISNGTITQRNISGATSEGIESEIDWHPAPWVAVSPHATFHKSSQHSPNTVTVREKDSSVINATLDYVPDLLAGCGLSLSRDVGGAKIDAQIGYNYVGKRIFADMAKEWVKSELDGLKYYIPFLPLPSYHLFDISCRCTLRNRYWFSIGVQNLSGVKYRESGGNIAPGRFATVKVGYDF